MEPSVSACQFSTEELDYVKSHFDAGSILTCLPKQIWLCLSASVFRTVHVRILSSKGYPSSPAHVELRSRTVGEKTLKKLEERIEKQLVSLTSHSSSAPSSSSASSSPNPAPSPAPSSSSSHVRVVLSILKEVIDKAVLLSCSAEIEQIKSEKLFNEERDKWRTQETRGLLELEINEGNYFVKTEFLVPPDYPEHPVTVHSLESNLHTLLQTMLKSLINVMIYQHAKNQKTSEGKKEEENGQENTWLPTRDEILSLRHDVKFLRKMQTFTESGAESKQVRRQVARLVKSETQLQKKIQEEGVSALDAGEYLQDLSLKQFDENATQENATQENAAQDSAGKQEEKVSDQQNEEEVTAGPALEEEKKTAYEPHLLSVVRLLAQYVHGLSSLECSMCRQKIIPPVPPSAPSAPSAPSPSLPTPTNSAAPAKLKAGFSRAKKKTEVAENLPPGDRLSCGHWYHLKCLHKHLTALPPSPSAPLEVRESHRACHVCRRKISHYKWNEAFLRRAEKKAMLKQAHRREVEEIADFVGDEFSTKPQNEEEEEEDEDAWRPWEM